MSGSARVVGVLIATAAFGLSTLTVAAPASAAEVAAIPVGERPTAVDVDSATGTGYVVNSAAGTISVIDGASKRVTATIPVGGHPSDVAVNQRANRVYVAEPDSGRLLVLDGSRHMITGIVEVSEGAAVLDVDERTNTVYLGNRTSGAVEVVDGASDTLRATIPSTVTELAGVSVDPTRHLVYFASPRANTVEILDPEREAFIGSIPVGDAPTELAVRSASDTLYVANAGIHHLSVVDGASRTETDQILLRSAGSSVATKQAENVVYSNGGPNGVVKIDASTGKLADELSLGINPGGIDVDQTTGQLYVTDPLHHSVSLISNF